MIPTTEWLLMLRWVASDDADPLDDAGAWPGAHTADAPAIEGR